MLPLFFTATIESGASVVVEIRAEGKERSIRTNGVVMRSLYEPATVVQDAQDIVARRFGHIRNWVVVRNKLVNLR